MSDILIVDDERDIRELIADILGDEGFPTRTAANADEALAAINAEDPALRGNRLALLQRLAKRLGAVAELGQLSA